MDTQTWRGKALMMWALLTASVVGLNVIGWVLFSGYGYEFEPIVVAVTVGSAAVGLALSFLLPPLLRRRFIDAAARGEERPPEARAGTAGAGQLPEPGALVLSWMLIRAAFAEMPGLLAFVLTAIIGFGLPSVVLLVASLGALAATFPRHDEWTRVEREIVTARAVGSGLVP